MLKNTQINRAATKKIATALGSLNHQVVYVGGAVVSLYIDDPSADDVRPTKDVDLTMEIASVGALENLRIELIDRGFKQTFEDNVTCRFRFEDVKVDVMATRTIDWSPGNRWFEWGFKSAFAVPLDEVTIRLLPLPYYLASKFDAFFDRGFHDIWASHDFEDMVYLFNHVSDIVDQVLNAETVVKTYLRECAEKILESHHLQEAIVGNLFHEAQEMRFHLIISRLKSLTH